eukprot:2769328-Prymnesium_polylepis.1
MFLERTPRAQSTAHRAAAPARPAAAQGRKFCRVLNALVRSPFTLATQHVVEHAPLGLPLQ